MKNPSALARASRASVGAVALCLATWASACGPAGAQGTDAASSRSVAPAEGVALAELLPGWRMADGRHVAALHLVLEPGWKTYWRAPGEAGIPPVFGWDGSRNLASVVVRWPRPHVFDVNGVRTLGYGQDVVLPLVLSPDAPGADIALSARVDLGVCSDICVPVGLDIAGLLPPGGSANPVIEAALALQPGPAAKAGLGSVRCAVEPIADGLRLTADIDLPRIGPDEVAVVELSDRSAWVSPADSSRSGGTLTAMADLVPDAGTPLVLDRSALRFTIISGDRAVEFAGCPAG